jgi:hypothetical protein
MLKFLHWLVTSSENPNNMALTIKGILGTVISLVLLVSPLVHINVNQDQLTGITDGLVQIFLGFTTLVSLVAGVVGMIRKIKLNSAGLSITTTATVVPPAAQ